MEAGFFLRVFLRERRYANLGHLLPMFHIERAVKPGVSALPLGWPAACILPSDSRLAMVYHALPLEFGMDGGAYGVEPRTQRRKAIFPTARRADAPARNSKS